jgi:lysophospholipase L1-like esterase
MLQVCKPFVALLVGCALAACTNSSPGRVESASAGTSGVGGSSVSGAAGQGGGGNGASGEATAGGAGKSGMASGGTTSGGAGGASSAGTMGAAGGGASPFPEGIVKPRIMIVGDSISAGPGCYKKFLLENLTDNGYQSFEFVGEYTDDCGGGVMHSAVSCSTAEQYTQPSFTVPNCTDKTYQGLVPLATKHEPDLLMMQLGVNDVWSSKPVETILGSYATLVQQARAQNPKIVIVVAQIQKVKPDCDKDAIYALAEALVKAVPAWAAAQSQPTSPVFVADLWTNSDFSKAETNDCVHPNDVGAQRMGLNWFKALEGILPK